MNKDNFCVVTTGADLPNYIDEKDNVFKVPLYADFDSVETSAPSPWDYEKKLNLLIENGYTQILVPLISQKLSASYKNALQAVSSIKQPHIRIEIVDTKSISLGIGFLIQSLIEKITRNSEVTFDSLVKESEQFYNRVKIFVAIKKLDNLLKGGRVNNANYIIGRLLNIKPILEVNNEGLIVAINRVRTFGRAKLELIERIKENPMIRHLGIMYSGPKSDGEDLDRQIQEITGRKSDCIVKVNPAISVHTDVDALGVCIVE